MPTDSSIYLVVREPERSEHRVVRIGFVPFTIGTSERCDVRIARSERPVSLRVERQEGRYRIVAHRDAEDSGDHAGLDDVGAAATPTRGAWLHHGLNMRFAGVYLRFFSRAPRGDLLAASNSTVEVIDSPRVRTTGARQAVSFGGPPRPRAATPVYVPRALDAPPPRRRDPNDPPSARGASPHAGADPFDGPAWLGRLDDLAQRLAKTRPESRRRGNPDAAAP